MLKFITNFQAAIETFIGDAYKARYDETMDKSLVKTIFSIAVNAFVVGGMIGGLSGGKFDFQPFLNHISNFGMKYLQIAMVYGSNSANL